MTANTGTLIPAKIVPHDDADTYPTHSEEWGQGGFRTVASITARNNIPTARRKEGMLVYVSDSAPTGGGIVYQLAADLTTWNVFSAAAGSANSSDPVLAELRYISRQYANIIMGNAEAASAQSRRGNYFADGFEVTTFIRTSGLVSANYVQKQTDSDSDGTNDYVIQPSTTAVPTVVAASSYYGNMTDGGGLTKAFDGVKAGAGSQGSLNTARYVQTTGVQQNAFIGQDCGSAKSINKIVITPDTTAGAGGGFEVTGAVGAISFNAWGSNTLPGAAGWAVNQVPLLTSPVLIKTDKATAVTLTAVTGLASFRYITVTIQTGNGENRTYAVSEMEVYQNAGAINNMTLYGGLTSSTPFKVAAAPAYWRMWVDMQLTDINMDLTADFSAYASRNGGTNFQLLPLVDQVGDITGPLRLMRSDWIDCSAGHSAGSPCTLATKFVSANNRQFNFRRYLFEWRYT